MKLTSFYDAVKDYERITGETVPVQDYCEVREGCLFNPAETKYMKILPSNEWLIWAIQERDGVRYLWLDQSYGFMKSFVPFLLHVMEINELEWIATATSRNPAAHIRKWKMKRLTKYDYDFEGRSYYVLLGHKSNLK